MNEPFAGIAGLDKLIHEPARLAILTALNACHSADFLYLQRLTGLTAGNLSAHLTRLEEAGLVAIEKQFVNRRPNTQASLTETGQATIRQYWQTLDLLRRQASDWQPPSTSDEKLSER